MKNYTIQKDNNEKIVVKNIYCIGRNYSEHAEELGNAQPKEPFFFQKSIPSLNTTQEICIPQHRNIDYEVEIVLLVGKDGVGTSLEDSISFIDGYAIGIDLTDREYQNQLKSKKLPWLLSKSFLGSAVVSNFSSKPINEDFWLSLNGLKKQQGNFAQMTFSYAEQIFFLSNKVPLMKGDIIFTGTPKGVGSLQTKDKVEIGFGNKTVKTITVSSAK